MKTKRFFTLILLTLVTLAFVPNSFAQVIEIPDPVFKLKLCQTLTKYKQTACTVTKQDMESFTELNITGIISEHQIGFIAKNIIGIEHAINLTKLHIHRTHVSDYTLLSGLKKFTTLELPANNIMDTSSLAGLKGLESLRIDGNSVSDITPLSGLSELTGLDLSNNQIKDISPLTALTNLTSLSLDNNQITDTDINHLTELTNLETLVLSRNQITDIGPLAALTNLKSLHLDGNQIRNVSLITKLTNLQTLYIYDNPIKNRKPLLALLEQNPGIKIYVKKPMESVTSHLISFQGRTHEYRRCYQLDNGVRGRQRGFLYLP